MNLIALFIVLITIALSVLPIIGRGFLLILGEDVIKDQWFSQCLFFGALFIIIALVFLLFACVIFWAFWEVFFNAV